MDFPSLYLSLHFNPLGGKVCKDFTEGGNALQSHGYWTQFNRTQIQVGLASSNGVIIMKSPRPAAPALAAPRGSGFPQKDPEELVQKSVMYYPERMEFISCIRQKSNHSGKATKIRLG